MFNSDDPRLTAYVLGGKLNETEHAEIAAAIAASPELQAEVALIEQSAAFLNDSLQSTDGVALTDEQRRAIYASSADTSVELSDQARNVKGGFWRRAIIAVATTGIAASILVTFLLPTVQRVRHASRRVVQTPAGDGYLIDVAPSATELH